MKPGDRGLSALEVTIGRVLRLGVGASSVLLAAGLFLTLLGRGDRIAHTVLTTPFSFSSRRRRRAS